MYLKSRIKQLLAYPLKSTTQYTIRRSPLKPIRRRFNLLSPILLRFTLRGCVVF